MSNRTYGYVRVSTRDQNEDRQVIALREFGISPASIVVEKISGKDFNRPKYREMVRKLRPGDVLVVGSIDRLGRNYDEIIEQWRHITKEVCADIVVIDMPLLDTRPKNKDLTASFVADIVLQILSYVAETERLNNRQRQAQGIAAAKARGVKFGRKLIARPRGFGVVHERWQMGEISARKAALQLGVSRSTFMRWVREVGG